MFVLFSPRSLRFAKELEKLVGDVMRYILFNIGKQNSQPIAREKVTALVTKKYARKTGLSQTVLQKARHRFAHIWGMDLRELVKTTADAGAKAAFSFPIGPRPVGPAPARNLSGVRSAAVNFSGCLAEPSCRSILTVKHDNGFRISHSLLFTTCSAFSRYRRFRDK